ncbi:Sec-independent protein translocase subunit TatA [Streptomyces sp. NPDC006976]|uniref:Sec-independent protein translocase subunit TatA n=1 Tax=Streptomyces sp. NPDC006976 TaxID=3154311 RepID=UPI00340D63B1
MLRNGLEPWHLLVVAIVIIMLFGSKKLPDMARSLGKSARILKSEAKAMKGDEGVPSAAPAPDDAPAEARRVIRTSPGDSATARPASEQKAAG